MTRLYSGSRTVAAEIGAEPTDRLLVSAGGGPREWDDYVAGHSEATAEHLWGWQQVFGAMGQQCVYLTARRGDRVAGVLPLVLFRSRLFGRSVVSVPLLSDGGLLTDDDEAAGVLVAEAKAEAVRFGASHVEFRHRRRRLPDEPCRQHKVGFALELPGSAEELWKTVDRKIRNQVRKAQKSRLEATVGGADRLDEFYPIFARNMRDLGTPVYPERLFREVLRAFPERARVHIVRHGGRPIAGAITVRCGGTVVNPWASALREFRHLCSNMLLYWSMLEHAVTGGASVFDFGRSSPGAGTYHFKRQWGAREIPLFWEYLLLDGQQTLPDVSPANPRMRAAVAVWQRLPLAVANRLGPVIARHLP